MDSRKKEESKELPVYPLEKTFKSYVPNSLYKLMLNLLKFGHIYELVDLWEKRRKQIGLTEAPPTAYTHKEAVEELSYIIEKLGFDKLIGFDIKKKEFKSL
jgi:heterodisulfide reductase subunit C